jgi:uncharacterized protein YbaP (TraB family)
MKRTVVILLTFLPYLLLAQPPVKKKKYPSLLWEISGHGLKKSSYLFGTMHVSSKMAFHLADSFYIGLRNADMVALETNPESWQEDMSKYELDNKDPDNYDFGYRYNGYLSSPDDYFTISTLRFYRYDKKIERSLYSNPSTINNLLYRSYGNESSDFEEDTYLDMYIYQCGKKWGKKVAGVEKYGESMKLMAEAYRDAAKDKNKKERSFDSEDGYSAGNLQEAYRTGNLDWLDSINRYNSFSTAFDEKFLYRRNEIQANSIDSILKTHQSLFVGVGAAHLPGQRGVIEILRDKGYTVRPVKMGERDSQHKNQVEKIRVPVLFTTQSVVDGMYKVDIPGRFYKFGDEASLDQRQYADMANGSYYMVTRIMTNAWMWGHSQKKVYRVIDSLLYENIPGKIISKTAITKNGYPGIDLTNRTRRGDIQRYNIFITPFEIIIFKMGGTGDYVNLGDEAKRFFGSIRLTPTVRPIITGNGPYGSYSWKKYSPSYGGFSVYLPHDPYVGNDGSWIYDAEDRGEEYRVIRTDIHNYRFAEEDSFDLGLMEESFGSSEFIDTAINRRLTTWQGYPALDVKYKDKNGGIYLTRFIIQGPHYYTLVAHGKQESQLMKYFLDSFAIQPLIYKPAKEKTDTSLYYNVRTPVFSEPDKEKLEIPRYNYLSAGEDDDSEDDALETGIFRSKIISNDSTGEKIFITFYKTQRYSYIKDSAILDKQNQVSIFGDTTWIVRSKKKERLPDGTRVWEAQVSDTGSSRMIWNKTFYKDGIGYSLSTELDTLSSPSDFLRSFFETFTPADSLKGTNPFVKKTDLFFADFLNSDSSIHQRALKGLYLVKMDSVDFPQLKKAINSLNWKERKYLDTKKALISKLDDITTREASDYLKALYYAAGDTIELQYSILEILLQQKTNYSFALFRDIITNEPPVLNVGNGHKWSGSAPAVSNLVAPRKNDIDNNNFLDELYDSLKLTRTILPDLLPLVNLDDYKFAIMQLLARMADKKLVTAKDYEIYFSKFLLEAKQEIKRQLITEKRRAISKAEKAKENNKPSVFSFQEENRDFGNERLNLYANLLLPFLETRPTVKPVIDQLLSSADKKLKYRTLFALIHSGKPSPDSLLNYFANLDDYRYDLYSDIKKTENGPEFPSRYNNQADLAKSRLLEEKSYGAPDSLVFLDKLPATVKNRRGFIFFYKYKLKKADASWKLATVGLVPEDPSLFEFDDDDDYTLMEDAADRSRYNFTAFTDTRLKPDQPVADQLKKECKRMLYSRRKSAREFYEKESNEGYDLGSEEP